MQGKRIEIINIVFVAINFPHVGSTSAAGLLFVEGQISTGELLLSGRMNTE